MSTEAMSSMQRVLSALGHTEADRVPLFLLATMHGARELGLSIEEYFADGRLVAEGQLRMRAKYRHDCLYSFFYAPIEVEAWGGDVVYSEDGPPNSAEPMLAKADDISSLAPPDVASSPCLRKVLHATNLMKERIGDDAPIIGVVMAPFSLPVMQLGFEAYLEVLFERPQLFERLMEINEAFCVEWANAQLEAGATAICYFDPVSSSTIVPRETYLKTGLLVAKRTLAKINGPAANHFASGRCEAILEDVASTGAAVAGVSAEEDLAKLKAAAAGKISLLGNLNGIAMRRWTAAEATDAVKTAIAKAGRGGGFIVSDNHGEIPFQVREETLMAISEAVHEWGRYPLAWTDDAG